MNNMNIVTSSVGIFDYSVAMWIVVLVNNIMMNDVFYE